MLITFKLVKMYGKYVPNYWNNSELIVETNSVVFNDCNIYFSYNNTAYQTWLPSQEITKDLRKELFEFGRLNLMNFDTEVIEPITIDVNEEEE